MEISLVRPINLFLLPLFFFGSKIFIGCTEKERDSLADSFFTDITDSVSINFNHDPGVDGSYFMPESIGSGGAFLDFDNDGDLDIYLINCARHGKNKYKGIPLRNHLYRQEADGTFLDVTEESGLGDTGYGMGVAVGDIDNDGNVDVYIANEGPDALYRNNGDGTFTDITKISGISNPGWGVSANFLDYNLDNYLDIVVVNYVKYDTATICPDRTGRRDYCGPQGFPGVADKLFHNNGDGTFEDISLSSGIAKKKSAGLGVASFDFNGDFYPDIYVNNDREQNHLWINQQDGTFKDQALIFGAAINELGMAEASMGIAVGDMDNDGDMDLFLTHFRGESNTFFRNLGEIGFQDDTTPAALASISLPFTGFGTGFFDYDHDGDLDLAIVNGRVIRGKIYTTRKPLRYWDHYAEPNLVFENDGSGQFRNVSNSASSFCDTVENSRGLAFGDVDNDGDVDLLITNEGGKARLYRNDVENKGNWLMIRAIDPALNRDAYGAKVTIVIGDNIFVRLINVGYSICSSNDPRAHFGLGTALAIDQIEILWPGGEKEIFRGIAINQIVTLEKGQGTSE